MNKCYLCWQFFMIKVPSCWCCLYKVHFCLDIWLACHLNFKKSCFLRCTPITFQYYTLFCVISNLEYKIWTVFDRKYIKWNENVKWEFDSFIVCIFVMIYVLPLKVKLLCLQQNFELTNSKVSVVVLIIWNDVSLILQPQFGSDWIIGYL